MKTPKKQTEITEAQVVSFFNARQNDLRTATGIKYSCIRAEADGFTGEINWFAYCDGAGLITGAPTVGEAIAKMADALRPDSRLARAKESRERAAALIAAAERLEKEAAK
jgi:hypothetical protein